MVVNEPFHIPHIKLNKTGFVRNKNVYTVFISVYETFEKPTETVILLLQVFRENPDANIPSFPKTLLFFPILPQTIQIKKF